MKRDKDPVVIKPGQSGPPVVRHRKHNTWMIRSVQSGMRTATANEAMLCEWFTAQGARTDAIAADAYADQLRRLVDVLSRDDLVGQALFDAIKQEVADTRELLGDVDEEQAA